MTVQPARIAQPPPPRSRAERPRASQSKRALSHLTIVSLIQPSALVNESDAGVCPVSSSRLSPARRRHGAPLLLAVAVDAATTQGRREGALARARRRRAPDPGHGKS